MGTDEYLEDLFRERYRFEADQDENVARTLPFFAASIAILVAFLGYAGEHVGHANPVASWIIAGLLFLALVAVARALWFLLLAVRARSYRLLPPETELLSYATALRGYYTGLGQTADTADGQTLNDVKTLVLTELAAAVVNNRDQNTQKVFARNQAFGSLIFAVGAVLLAGVAIFLSDGTDALRLNGRVSVGASSRTDCPETQDAPSNFDCQAGPAPAAFRDRRGEAAGVPRATPGGQSDSPQMSKTSPSSGLGAKTPTPSPAQKPMPPAPQMLKKSATDVPTGKR